MHIARPEHAANNDAARRVRLLEPSDQIGEDRLEGVAVVREIRHVLADGNHEDLGLERDQVVVLGEIKTLPTTFEGRNVLDAVVVLVVIRNLKD